ncbi:MAG: rhodanese-like domain-containing protein [bacterium]
MPPTPKNIARLLYIAAAALFLNVALSPLAHAVPPPDLIFSAVSNIGIILTFTTAFLASAFASIHMYVGAFLHTTKGRLIAAALFVFLCGVITGGIHYYQVWQQRRSYDEWLKQSQQAKTAEVDVTQVATASPTTTPTSTTTPAPTGDPSQPSFFATNKDLPRMISNADFSQALSTATPFVLDAREDEENRYGHFPESTHIRFADIVAGDWQKMPTDKVVYVLCWSGIRGKEVADFLYSKGIVARFLEKGADGWVTYGGTWSGGIKFDQIHPEERYHITLETDQVESAMQDGVTIVDSRPKETYQKWHIPGSVNLPIIYTPTSQLVTAFAQIPTGTKLITVCDDFVSCFDARLVGLKAEQDRQAVFMGRYAKPWEYRGRHP